MQFLRNLSARKRTPTVFQLEITECGPASLAMILAYHGKTVPLDTLRADCDISARDGCRALNLIRAAEKHGLAAKGYRLGVEKLKSIDAPVLIHWKFNHFIVLEGYGKGRFYLRDSCVGAFVENEAAVRKHYTGIVIQFSVAAGHKTKTKLEKTKNQWLRYVKGHEGILFLFTFMQLLLILPQYLLPVGAGFLVDKAYAHEAQHLLRLSLVLMVITCGVGWLVYVERMNRQRRMEQTNGALIQKTLSHLLRLPSHFFLSRAYSGQRAFLHGKITQILFGDAPELVASVLLVLALIFYALWYSFGMAVVLIVVSVLHLLFLLLTAKLQHDRIRKAEVESGALSQITVQEIMLMESTKAMGRENGAFLRWGRQQAKSGNDQQQNGFLQILEEVATEGFMWVALLAWMVMAVPRVHNGELTPGVLMAVFLLIVVSIERSSRIAEILAQFRQFRLTMDRLLDVTGAEEDVYYYSGDENGQQALTIRGVVSIRSVSYGYSRTSPPLIQGFSLELGLGETVVFVGPSGSGKSTLAHVVAGLYQPWEGEVCLDGVPLKSIPGRVISASVGLVPQNAVIFPGTIVDNIRLWNEEISLEAVEKALRDTFLYDEVMQWPEGLLTQLDANGANLSSGQAQQLEIARALVKDPVVLILDEATSALDIELEKRIHRNIRQRNCTCIIVAHRLDGLESYDHIILYKES